MKRRAQPAITIRSTRAVDRLKLLTRGGRSQAEIIEEALDRMPLPADAREARKQRILAAIREIQSIPGPKMTMTEFDALEYDEFGDPR